MRTALERAIEIAGGQSALARACGTIQQNIWDWLNKRDGTVPAEYVGKISAATGVPKHELRPDIFERAA